MALVLSNDEINDLKSLDIDVSKLVTNISISTDNISEEIKDTQKSSPNIGQSIDQTISSTQIKPLLSHHKNSLFPILSISGLTFLSFGGFYLFKSKNITVSTPPIVPSNPEVSPTQVPKSIQHYLLSSQQYFTQALQLQQNNPEVTPDRTSQLADLLNKAVYSATVAIKEFPSDYRAYEQRGRIYVSLTASRPELLPTAINDLSHAFKLNPNSPEIARSLATLYAKKGDPQSTLTYLTQTVNLEPTKAQNFYDLARLQQQTGRLPEAIATYDRLLSIVVDPSQVTAVTAEKEAISKLLSQSSGVQTSPSISPPEVSPTVTTEAPLLQANLPINLDTGSGLIIAAPETAQDITVSNLSSSNSLSGSGTLPANTASISISNSNLTANSQVYITVTKGGKNQNFQVLSRSKDAFTAGLDSPINEDIEFKWWIVN